MFCSRCGTVVAEGAAFCSTCGAPVAGTGIVAPVGAPAGAGPAGGPTVHYAGFWLRFVALIIDGLVLMIPVGIFFVMIAIALGLSIPFKRFPSVDTPDALWAGLGFEFITLIVLVSFVVNWIYYAACESSRWQATPGKMALGLYVTDLEGNRISFAQASGRFFGKLISKYLTIYIGFIMAGFTAKKQALHDILAGCLVLRKI